MHRIWDTIIEPVLEVLQPETIVEIGSGQGLNTRNLLEFCQRNDTKLHVVEPLPKYDVEAWQEKYGEHVTFHLDLSLNAIPLIGEYDVVIIDGDHNWYTVFNELELLEKQCVGSSRPFPLVLLHDIGWPYGRRDLYHDPETIPEAYRQPFEQKGMRPGSAGLLEKGGLFRHHFNSIYENNLRSGVLTAVEDFLGEGEQHLELVKLPGSYGVGLLVPRRLKEQNEEFAKLLEVLTLPSIIERYVERIEEERLEAEVSRQESLEERKEWVESLLDELKAHVTAGETRETEIVHLRRHLERRDQKLKDKDKELADGDKKLKDKDKELADKDKKLEDKDRSLANKDKKLKDKEEIEQRGSMDLEKLVRWIGQLDQGISALLNSRQWRVGHAFGELRRRALLQPRVPMAQDHLNDVLREVRAWHKSYKEAKSLPGAAKDTALETSGAQVADVETAPEQRESKASERETPARPEGNSHVGKPRSADIVVCVHNALEDVKACLAAVVENTSREFTLYIVNDGSEEATTEFLRKFSAAHESCVLLETPVAEGYTRAANRGLRASTADHVVLLNSDTIVPSRWLEKLMECGESDPRIGIVGPMSNAASWQSVPELHENGDWALNPLPKGYTVEDMSDMLTAVSERRFPRTPFINGFCLVLKRSLINAIGYFDEKNFPNGYGEENDYCLRAAEAGFELAIADHAYIYHAKSKSYSHERRHALRRPGTAALKEKYGDERVSRGVEIMRREPTLEEIRRRMRTKLEAASGDGTHGQSSPSSFTVLFLLLARGGGGGAHSVVQEAREMTELGVLARIAVPKEHQNLYLRAYPDLDPEIFNFFDSEETLTSYARGFDVVVATYFTSVKLLKALRDADPNIIPAYYVQDYEPWFAEAGSEKEREALESYTAVPGTLYFAKTDWLRQTVKKFHDIEVHKVSPSLDHAVYYPSFSVDGEKKNINIAAMLRPETPRRAPVETIEVLKLIKNEYGDAVSVTTFGCKPDDFRSLALPRISEFEDRGILNREGVAEVLRDADIFLDASTYQAFGRTGLEAMASGCATILPGNCGTSEYARHRENALLVDTKDFGQIVGAVKELVEVKELRRKLSMHGILTASDYSIRRAAASELLLFREELRERRSAGGSTKDGEA